MVSCFLHTQVDLWGLAGDGVAEIAILVAHGDIVASHDRGLFFIGNEGHGEFRVHVGGVCLGCDRKTAPTFPMRPQPPGLSAVVRSSRGGEYAVSCYGLRVGKKLVLGKFVSTLAGST